MTSPATRPNAVTVACWLLVLGSALLVVGGVLSSLVSFDSLREAAPATVTDDAVRSYVRLSRGIGVLFALTGVALAWFAVRARNRDPRARRAAMALGLAVVVVVAVAAVFAGTHILALLGLLPIIIGALLLNRPSVVDWYAGD